MRIPRASSRYRAPSARRFCIGGPWLPSRASGRSCVEPGPQGRAEDEVSQACRGRSGTAGFTLIEMLVTLAIMGIATALALGGMGSISAGRRMAFTSDVIAAEIDRLRVEAMRTGRRGRLVFELGAERFLSSRPGAGAISTHGAQVTMETRPGGKVDPGEIWLLPDGSSTGGRIVLAAQGGGVVLSVSALTGLVRRGDLP